MSMPVAIVNYSKKFTGVAICIRLYYEHLLRLGYNVKWYQFIEPGHESEYMAFPEVLKGSHFPGKSLKLGYERLVFVPSKASLVKEQYLFLSDPTLIRLGLKKKGFMVMVHDLIPLKSDYNRYSSRPMFRYAIPRLNSASTIIVPSKHIREQVAEYVNDEDKIFVVTEFVEVKPSQKHREQSIQRMKQGKINLFFIAADRPHKNVKFFMELAKHFSSRGLTHYSFTLVSDLGDENKKFLEDLGLNNLEVLRNIPDIEPIFDRGDILIDPSDLEGFGRPVLEAMALGIPVIASDIAPFTELLSKSGVFLPEKSYVDWEGAILKLSSPDEYSEHSQAVQKRYEENFSEKNYAEQLTLAFKHFVESTREVTR